MIVYWILVLIYACFIFFMSNMIVDEYNIKSKATISETVGKTIETTNKIGITYKHTSKDKMEQVIEKLNYPLRKVAHASEYFIFTILILIALKIVMLKEKFYYFINDLLYVCLYR